jgi:hypothetical protein
MPVQQHDRRPFAAVPDSQRCLSDIDELDLKPVEEPTPEGIPEIASLRTPAAFGDPAR